MLKKHTQKARKLIRKPQKLMKSADKSKDGWQVEAEYELEEFASGSEKEKHLKKAGKAESRKSVRRTKSLATEERNQKLLWVLTISFFVVRTSACILLSKITWFIWIRLGILPYSLSDLFVL